MCTNLDIFYRSIFLTGAIAFGSGLFRSEQLTAGVTRVNCSGEEMALSECKLQNIPILGSCEQDAEVICRGNDFRYRYTPHIIQKKAS